MACSRRQLWLEEDPAGELQFPNNSGLHTCISFSQAYLWLHHGAANRLRRHATGHTPHTMLIAELGGNVPAEMQCQVYAAAIRTSCRPFSHGSLQQAAPSQ